eukprot:CAMPEP_0185570164 /NCGR_PEP_ID=MMETSP0434-20130131/2571_1 /TAXON_ID=626734 ORGANISM="Favella taraikaensis, Strain Fe Narragansett Bay" /NCGR_SAMPLE_ID=MMETSP0434 /ASSEMBLY_ACC=CAM_ASM_000379 /LENGTH=64 /DNA_ID=CAMNT_0028185203 /DNA_START=369 /DNA_END=563 /DNA_ORIENTATION=+
MPFTTVKLSAPKVNDCVLIDEKALGKNGRKPLPSSYISLDSSANSITSVVNLFGKRVKHDYNLD